MIFNDALECLYFPNDQSRAEFLRASLHGEVFGVQAFSEDLVCDAPGGLRPRVHLSICSADRQVGTFLAHAARFASAVTAGTAQTVHVRMQWRGLKGRILSRWGFKGDQTLDETYKCDEQDVVALWNGKSESVCIPEVKSNLAQLVWKFTEDLHKAFEPQPGASTFHPGRQRIREDLEELQQWVGT